MIGIWARAMQWNIPDDTDLAVYFGRCLGAFILIEAYTFVKYLKGPETDSGPVSLASGCFILLTHRP